MARATQASDRVDEHDRFASLGKWRLSRSGKDKVNKIAEEKFAEGRITSGQSFIFVMPGLVPGIHVLLRAGAKDVDGRDKPGHDEL